MGKGKKVRKRKVYIVKAKEGLGKLPRGFKFLLLSKKEGDGNKFILVPN